MEVATWFESLVVLTVVSIHSVVPADPVTPDFLRPNLNVSDISDLLGLLEKSKIPTFDRIDRNGRVEDVALAVEGMFGSADIAEQHPSPSDS